MKKIISVFIVNILCLTTLMAQENVSDIRVELRDTLLHVTYNLQKDSNVEIYYSSSDGAKYIGPLKEVTGDCGVDVKAGTDRVIVWNPVEEVGYIEAPNSVIKIVADAIPEPEPEPEPEPIAKKDWGKHSMWMVGVSLTNGEIADMPISLMYGHYRHFGWYIKAESNIPTHSIDFNYSSQINLTDEFRLAYTALKTGFLWNINNKFLLNLGFGAQVDIAGVAIEDPNSVDGEQVAVAIYTPNDHKGFPFYNISNTENETSMYFVGEIGVTYNWRKLSIGVNVTPNFNRFVGYEGMGAEEYSQSYSGGEYENYEEWATPIYKTKFITSVLLGINF